MFQKTKLLLIFPLQKTMFWVKSCLIYWNISMTTSPCQYTGYTSTIQALSNLERSLKVHCLILKIHAILDHGLILKKGQSSQLVFRQEATVLPIWWIYNCFTNNCKVFIPIIVAIVVVVMYFFSFLIENNFCNVILKNVLLWSADRHISYLTLVIALHI